MPQGFAGALEEAQHALGMQPDSLPAHSSDPNEAGAHAQAAPAYTSIWSDLVAEVQAEALREEDLCLGGDLEEGAVLPAYPSRRHTCWYVLQ